MFTVKSCVAVRSQTKRSLVVVVAAVEVKHDVIHHISSAGGADDQTRQHSGGVSCRTELTA